MVADNERASEALGFKAAVGIAGLVGLIGGILFGVWDSVTVITGDATPPVTVPVMLYLSLYSAALYAVIGCLGMAAVGTISAVVIRIGRYNVRKLQLGGLFVGIVVLLVVFALLAPEIIVTRNMIIVVESTVICMISGVGLGGLSVYVLDKVPRRQKLIAACISLFVSLLVLLYGGSWVNFGLLPEEPFLRPTGLLANVVLFLLVTLLAIGLYILLVMILERHDSRRTGQVGYILLAVMVCGFTAVSFLGPFSLENNPEARASAITNTGTMADSESLRERPNILWIVMDTVRADHLSCYGYQRNTTPNIDRIASEGILFENAISAAPWTLPSHASMFTGMFPSKHGTDMEHQWLDHDFETIAEVLHSYGYKTFLYSNNGYVSSLTNLSQGFDTLEIRLSGKRKAASKGYHIATTATLLTDELKINFAMRNAHNYLLTDDGARETNPLVKRWIADAHKAGAPFFVFINYMEAHLPYHPPKSYAEPYLNKDVSFSEAISVKQDHFAYLSGTAYMDDEDFDIFRALYDGEIAYLDSRMGQLFDYLLELGILDNTVLIITSDHGENFGEHHLMGHQLCVYDTLLHVPLVIRYPGLIEAGQRVSEQVQLTDIYPTILDILAIDQDGEEIQGYSLLRQRQSGEPNFAIAEYAIPWGELDDLMERDPEFDCSIYARRLKTVRTEEFKYIWGSDGRDELYNIRRDPKELVNLIETEPEQARKLRARLREWLDSFKMYRPEVAQQVR